LKSITQLYDDKLQSNKENAQNRETEMQIFAFASFLNRYGIKKVAERKYTEFLVSVKNYSQVFRINVFARMINILDEKLNYSVDEMKKYLEAFEYLIYFCSSGVSIPHEPTDIKRYTPYIRCLDFLRIFSENRLSQEELREIRNELESIKVIQKKNKTKL
jgi:hypothetical protein